MGTKLITFYSTKKKKLPQGNDITRLFKTFFHASLPDTKACRHKCQNGLANSRICYLVTTKCK